MIFTFKVLFLAESLPSTLGASLRGVLKVIAQITIYEGDTPITQADFYYERGRNRIVVFVDGSPRTPDHVQEEDREKRINIEAMGYSVVVLDLKGGKYIDDPSKIEKEIINKLK